jgi:hypothetical protein
MYLRVIASLCAGLKGSRLLFLHSKGPTIDNKVSNCAGVILVYKKNHS